MLLSVGAEFISEARTQEKYGLVIGTDFNIPALFFDPEAKKVQGELYSVSDYKIDDVDALEGHPVVYTRKTMKICYEEKTVEAFVYVIEDPHEKLLAKMRLEEYKIEDTEKYIPPSKRFPEIKDVEEKRKLLSAQFKSQ
ncbi:Oidioi.mRNA.OKI2018_I69.chr1.g934.t1.cds [Oikopleura dioica]|uniref:Gamma-glutamylcyclotransferase family protein n=1 Tax=Oikopleura dioica TaxID=34765 RepID=A0ABN7SLE7_OIKDI|nr:Oidioi.mRNA.OKI2018_I69.chr1.g934.t1.cds [Oikopleura dioica]